MFGFLFDRGLEHLRQPDRAPRCYELTDAERAEKVRQLGYLNGGAYIPKVNGGVAPSAGSVR